MTLRDTIRSFLQSSLEWSKKWRDYFGAYKKIYEQKLAEERLLAELRKKSRAAKKVK